MHPKKNVNARLCNHQLEPACSPDAGQMNEQCSPAAELHLACIAMHFCLQHYQMWHVWMMLMDLACAPLQGRSDSHPHGAARIICGRPNRQTVQPCYIESVLRSQALSTQYRNIMACWDDDYGHSTRTSARPAKDANSQSCQEHLRQGRRRCRAAMQALPGPCSGCCRQLLTTCMAPLADWTA